MSTVRPLFQLHLARWGFAVAAILVSLGAMQIMGSHPASATSGPGCFRVGGIPPSEPLNLRRRPSAKSQIIGKLYVGKHGIIAENGACVPHDRPPSKQWCPVKIYDGDGVQKGWLKQTFLRNSHCP